MSEDISGIRYVEYDPVNGTHYHSVRSVLYSGRTAYQDVTILDTEEWGKTLILDGDIQSTELDESILHEAIVHPVMISSPNPRQVLILGSGEGGTLREVLSYGTVERCVMTDIDEDFVDICAEHLPEWSEGCFEEANVELEFDDGKDYLARTDAKFDVIIAEISHYDDDGTALVQEMSSYFKLFKDRLAPDGLLVVHGLEFDPLEPAEHVLARKALAKLFPTVLTYSVHVPSFRGETAFVIATNGPDPSKLERRDIEKRLAERGANEDKDIAGALYFYDADAHMRMFSLPKNLKTALNGSGIPGDGSG